MWLIGVQFAPRFEVMIMIFIIKYLLMSVYLFHFSLQATV